MNLINMNTRDKAIELVKEHFPDRELMLYIKSSDLVYESILDTVQKALNIDLVMLSFTDNERTRFIEETIMYNKQNLNGRETEDEIYEAGVCAGFDDLLEKLNEA